MTRESPSWVWVNEQIRKWMGIGSRTPTRLAINELSAETLFSFFEKHKDITFSKEGEPSNSGAHIVAYQKALNLLNGNANLQIDGFFGNNTKSAIQLFQRRHNLWWKNGIPWPETATAMIQALKLKLPKKEEMIKTPPVTPLKKAEKILSESGYTETGKVGEYKNTDLNTIIIIQWNTATTTERHRNLKETDFESRTVLLDKINKVLNP